jgi:putative FmdB family regulatory protein
VPTYQYRCTQCGHELEVVQKFTDDPLTVCPDCEGALRKLFSAVGVVFKGSGFYRTDSRSNNEKSRADSSGSDKAKATADSAGSSTKSDGASKTSSTSDAGASKPAASSSSNSSGKSAAAKSTSAA